MILKSLMKCTGSVGGSVRSSVIGFALALVILTPLTAHANWEKIPSSEFQLPAPPDQAASVLEVDELLDLQAVRTKTECDLGEKQADPSFKKLFGGSGLLTPQELKTLEPLMEKVSHLGERAHALTTSTQEFSHA